MSRVAGFFKRALMFSLLAIMVVYAGDYLLAAHRIGGPKRAAALGSITIAPTYVIPHKDGRAEIVVGDSATQTCLHSMFPHFGFLPCWYLSRKQAKPTVISRAVPCRRATPNIAG